MNDQLVGAGYEMAMSLGLDDLTYDDLIYLGMFATRCFED